MYKDYEKIFLYAVAAVSIVLFMKYALIYILPFLIALLVIIPVQRFCTRHKICMKNGRGILSGGIFVIFLLLLFVIAVGMIAFMLHKIQEISLNQELLWYELTQQITDGSRWLEQILGLKYGCVENWTLKRIDEGIIFINERSAALLAKTAQYIVSIGRIGALFLVSFICVIFLSREIEDWKNGMLNLAAREYSIDRILAIMIRLGKKTGNMLKTYLKTQGIIFCCISLVAVVGLYIAGIADAWFFGLLAAFLDVLPFIGTGFVFVPAVAIQIFQQKWLSVIILIIVYICCVMIREFLEPRLMGNGMRFSPVAILLSVYAGVLLYGVSGVLLGPITVLLLVETAKEILV